MKNFLFLSTALAVFAQINHANAQSFLIQTAEISPFVAVQEDETTYHTLAQSKKRHSNTLAKSVSMRQAQSQSLHKKHKSTPNTWAHDYIKAKQEFTNATGISYTIDASILGQRGAPNGHITPWQTQYYGSLNWDLFNSSTFGAGSIQMAYTLVRYWNQNASILGNNIGIATSLNDYTEKANYFDQLSYTHQFAGAFKWLSVTLGQFPLYNFDGTTYNSNQQINFINEALSQNQTSLYPSAGLGGYVTVTPNNLISLSAGLQDATNVSGDRLNSSHFKEKKYTPFISATLSPTNALGALQLSVLLYHQPSVPEQEGNAKGWSFNVQQNIGKKWAVFGRINGVSKGINGFNQSYVLGGVYNNPLNRNELDQIGLAFAMNKINKSYFEEQNRSVENIVEAYWAWGISSFVTITPDIQFYINPALNKKSNTATVASLRATFMF